MHVLVNWGFGFSARGAIAALSRICSFLAPFISTCDIGVTYVETVLVDVLHDSTSLAGGLLVGRALAVREYHPIPCIPSKSIHR
mmetsp:Transcript_39268/g.80064  ORF Transcript_39268/g.80064 Transcript_39268/m.80064 type:complete len:84 (+) Transcript_39268:30-281(+)